MEKKFEITKDQCFCSFGDGIIYEFMSSHGKPIANLCDVCAFCDKQKIPNHKEMCHSVPCVGWKRNDKVCGFWIRSNIIDYHAFTKMLEYGD